MEYMKLPVMLQESVVPWEEGGWASDKKEMFSFIICTLDTRAMKTKTAIKFLLKNDGLALVKTTGGEETWYPPAEGWKVTSAVL